MASHDFIWIASIIVGMTVLGWLVIDWLESAYTWDQSAENTEIDPALRGQLLVKDEYPSREAFDLETELLLCYPLDPFAPAMLWRPQPQDGWNEAQVSPADGMTTPMPHATPELRGSEAA